MHPRRIPLLLALGLMTVGVWLLFAPYGVEATAGVPPDELELTADCPSPVVDLVSDRTPSWSLKGESLNQGLLFAASPGPCTSGRSERGFAGLALIAGGVVLLVITDLRRRRRRR